MTGPSPAHASPAPAAWTLPVAVRPLEAAKALGAPQLFWAREAEGVSLAGFGIADTRRGDDLRGGLLESLERDVQLRQRAGGQRLPPLVWLGGVGFGAAPSRDPRWTGFGQVRFQLPRLAVWSEGDASFVTAFAADASEARAAADRARARLGEARVPAAPSGPGRAPTLRRPGDAGGWHELHARAMAAIASGALSKVVLARPVDLEGALSGPIPVLERLGEDGRQGTLFAFQGEGDAWFVGLTPETLVRVRDGVVSTEAIAGTARTGLGEALLSDERMLREQGAVVSAIRDALSPLCDRLEVPSRPELLSLRDLVHLRTPVEGHLREGVSLDAVVRALHPTPATGGTPRERALPFLAEHEGFDRGWYAGALGGVGPMGLHLSVGLRSALLHPGGARLFVGAGVVAGSTAQVEWDETEAKALPMLRAVGLTGG